MSLYLGTDLISGATKITLETFVDAFYPVGSVFIGTTATCPLAAVKGTWTLRSTGIVTSVNTNVPCKGNGITVGWTNGTTSGGTISNSASGSRYGLMAKDVSLGAPVDGTSVSGNVIYGKLGIVTDETKSGIVGTVTRTTLTVNIWERTA